MASVRRIQNEGKTNVVKGDEELVEVEEISRRRRREERLRSDVESSVV